MLSFLLLSACAGTVGCAPAWRPPVEPRPVAEMAISVDLRPYLPSPTPGPRVFARRDLKRPTVSLTDYVQIVRRDGIVEGSFAWPGGTAGANEDLARSAEQPRDGAVFAISLDPPLPRIPAAIDAVEPARMQANARVHDARGRERFRGTVDRVVAWEGFERVELDGRAPADCARLRCVTRIRLFLGPWIELTEYIWLARDLGEVRRIERFRGWAWIWPFDEVRQYDLVRPLSPVRRTASHPAAIPEAWARLRIHLERVLPSPQLGGIAVEYAMEPTAPPERLAHAERGRIPEGN
jgi:hypothetical protein